MRVVRSHPCGCGLARSILCGSIVLGLCILASMAFSADAAQPPAEAAGAEQGSYLVDPVRADLFRDRSLIGKMRTAGKFAAGEQATFDRYYNEYALPRWTVPGDAAALEGYRRELSNDLRNSSAGPVRDRLIALAFDYMRSRVGKNYCPAFRVNAMLMIGEFNAVEPAGFGSSPVPLPEALPVLVQAVEDPQQIDAVKVAALVGILRYLELGAVTAPNTRKAVSDTALALLGSERPPGRSADGHAWMREQAAEVLGELGEAGQSGVVATTLAAAVAEAASPMETRCAAAEALGKLNYQGVGGLDASKLAVPLGRLAVDACAAEAKARAETEAARLASPTTAAAASQPIFGLGQPLAGTAGSESLPPIPLVSRRRLKYRINAARVGLEGVAAMAKATPAEKSVAAIRQPVQAIFDVIEETRTDDDGDLQAMMRKIGAEAAKLKAVLPQ